MPLVDLANVRELFGPGLGRGAPFAGALVSKSSDQPILNVTPSVIIWQTVEYDVGGWFDSIGDAFFTVPQGFTRVELVAGVRWAAPAGGAFRQIDFRKNGSSFPGATKVVTTLGAAAIDAHGIASPAIEVTAGDTLSVAVFQVSGAALNVNADAATFFAVRAAEGVPLTATAPVFTSLIDTPSSYLGEAGKHLHVNSAETEVEFGQPLRTVDKPTFTGLTTTAGARNIARRAFTVSTSTAILGLRELYACTDTSAPRVLAIASADIATGFANPWRFTVKDESGGANANNITIVTGGAETIDGASSIAITENYGSVTLYADGFNLFSV